MGSLFNMCVPICITIFIVSIDEVFSQNIEEGRILVSDSGISSTSNNEARDCKAILECKPFLWLLQNNRTQKVLQDLVARDCGFRGASQLIWCPIEEKIEPSSLLPDFNDTEETRGGGILTSLIRSEDKCSGSLTMMHYGGETDSEFKRTRMTGKSYRNLKILETRVVVKIETEGNCCWKLHSEVSFRGHEQEAEPGYSNPPDIQPKSIQKVSC